MDCRCMSTEQIMFVLFFVLHNAAQRRAVSKHMNIKRNVAH